MTTAPTAKTYLTIFGWLLALTVLEVAVVLWRWPQGAIVTVLLATALAKASLIALYFMHLKFDRRAVWLLPGVPIALALFFIGMVWPDLVLHLPQCF